jgi:glycosyltransferase involved in cell wall biosynthesis
MHLNKHIVWIVPGFASSESDDTCIPTLLDLLNYIKKNTDHRISIVSLQYPFTNQPYQITGSDVYPMNGKNKWWNKAAVWKKALNTLDELNSQHPIHLIHSFWLGDTTLIAEAFSQQKKTKYICTLMGQDALKENRRLSNSRLSKTYIIALSDIQAETFYRNSGRRVHETIPFGIPDLDFEAQEKKYDIIGVGSLIPLKNYEMWIEIVELAKKQVPTIKALLIGEGEEHEELKNQIQKKGLGSTISLVGKKPRMETLRLIDESKIFVHTSKYEGQGYVLSEAMSRKLAILSTPVGYALENEKIWKGTSPEDFANEISHLLRKSDLKVNYKFMQMKDTWEKYKKIYS